MKVIVILCLLAHFSNATPPFTNLFSGILNPLGASGASESDSDAESESPSASPFGGFGGASAGGFNPRQIAGDVLGVKVNLLTALRNTIVGEQEFDLGTNGEEYTAGAAVDGTGNGIGGSQAYSQSSGFAEMNHAGAGYANQQSGYNYERPAAGYAAPQNSYIPPVAPQNSYGPPAVPQNTYGAPAASSGYAADGGYSYSRPQSVGAGYAAQHNSALGSSNSINYNGGYSVSQVGGSSAASTSSFSGQATQSGTAGFSSGGSGGGGHAGLSEFLFVWPLNFIV